MKPKQRPPGRKPRYVAFVATSIDGRISLAKNKPPDWTSREDWNFLQRSLARIDAVVVGRNTYTAAAARLRKRNTYVLSSRAKSTKRMGTVTFVNPKYVELKKLLVGYKTVAILGGAMVYQTMLQKKLLDELYVTIEPLVFGRGTAMFAGGIQTHKLRLVSVRRLNSSGTLLLHYIVLR